MLDYNKIQELFGSLLNTVPKPQVTFKLKPWHVIGGLVLGYLFYRGAKVVINENIKKSLAEN
jgi:hypothetical protein